jgi:hypothetical protein
MFIYFFFYFLVLLFALFFKASKIRYFDVLLLSFLGCFLTMGYMTGSDWRSYEMEYESLDKETLQGQEYGWYIYKSIFKILGIKFWHFFIFTKLLCYTLILNSLKKFSCVNYYWALLIFFGVFSLDAFIDNPMRNLIAGVIFLMSLSYIVERELLKFLFILLLASLFHTSALLMIPLYFVDKFDVNFKKVFLSFCLFVSLIFFAQVYFREIILFVVWNYGGFLSERFNPVYLHESFYIRHPGVTWGFVFHYMLFGLIYFKKSEFERLKHGKLLFNLSFIYMIVYSISFMIWIFFRFRLYLFVPFSICVGYLPFFYVRFYTKLVSITCIVIVSFFVMKSTIKGSYKYIPYTNYLLEPERNFDERSRFNFNHSPYIDDENDEN